MVFFKWYIHSNLKFKLDIFGKWRSLNGLKTNSSKTKSMIVSTSPRSKNNLRNVLSFKISGSSKQYNYLGIIQYFFLLISVNNSDKHAKLFYPFL